MARIREYTNKEEINPGPLRALADAQASSGYRIGQAYAQIGDTIAGGIKDYDKFKSQGDTLKLIKEGPMTNAELHVLWQDTMKTADPNDPNLAQRFMDEQVTPRLDKMGEGISSDAGKEMYARTRAGIMSEFLVKTHGNEAELKGLQAVNGITTSLNLLEATVRQHPDNFEGSVEQARITIQGAIKSFNLDSAMALKMEQNTLKGLAMSALQGLADQDPKAAKKAIVDGRFSEYLGGEQLTQADHYADARQNALDNDAKAAKVAERQANKDDFDKQTSALSGALTAQEGTLRVPDGFNVKLLELSQHPGADSGTIRALGNLAQEIARRKEPTKTDPFTEMYLRSRMMIPSGSSGAVTMAEVYQAEADGRLDKDDALMYRGWVENGSKDPAKVANEKEFNHFLDANKSLITKSSAMTTDGIGNLLFDQFRKAKYAQYQKGLKDGLTQQQMLTAGSPNYIGKDVARYAPSNALNMRAMTDQAAGKVGELPIVGDEVAAEPAPPPKAAAGPAPPPKAAGESMAAYVARAKAAMAAKAAPAKAAPEEDLQLDVGAGPAHAPTKGPHESEADFKERLRVYSTPDPNTPLRGTQK